MKADILKSCRRLLAMLFETPQVWPILKNCYVAENQAFLEMSDQRHPGFLVLEWLKACIFHDTCFNFHIFRSHKTERERAAWGVEIPRPSHFCCVTPGSTAGITSV